MQKINGTSSSNQSLSSSIEYYTVFCSATNAVTDPENVLGVDINVTGDLSDISQKNFEVLLMSIGLRAMPVIMNDPVATEDLDLMGAPTLIGEGYVWKFAVERQNMFDNGVSDVGYLIDEVDYIVLPNGVTIRTTQKIGDPPSVINVEFVKHTGL
jgi:hypothetical protein